MIFVPRYGLCWIQKLECNRGVETEQRVYAGHRRRERMRSIHANEEGRQILRGVLELEGHAHRRLARIIRSMLSADLNQPVMPGSESVIDCVVSLLAWPTLSRDDFRR